MAFTPNPEVAKQKAKDALAKLEAGVASLVSSETWQAYLATQARFHKYSFGNVMMIHLQRPTASQVAGYTTWQSLGRQVRKGEKGISIWAPMTIRTTEPDPNDPSAERERFLTRFKLVSVFDISQTDGKDLPEPCARLQGHDGAWLVDKLESLARSKGWTVTRDTAIAPANGCCCFGSRTITILPWLSADQQAKTLAHELAHALLHGESDLPTDRKELEAESTAYVVLQACGIDSGSYSFGYLASWSRGKNFTTELKASAQAIQKTAAAILDAILAKTEVAA